MAFSKSLGNKSGLNRNWGNGQPDDEKSNSSPSSGSKRIGTISGRITRSKSGHQAGTSLMGNGNGLSNAFGNALPYEDGASRLPSRGLKDGG